MTTTTTETVPGADGGYGARWARVPRELAYLVIKLPIALVGFVVTVSLFSAGVGTVVTFFIGVILAIAALYVARGFGTLELALLRWTGRPGIKRPEWQDARARTGFFGWLRAVLGNGHYWMYLLHTMVVDLLVGTVTWSIALSWATAGLGGVSYWFWDMLIPRPDHNWFLSEWILPRVGVQSGTINFALADSLINLVVGAVLLVTLPFITRALVSLHWVIARGMLGPFKSDALERELASAERSRGAAISAEGRSLRRLERDIHDGPQQRLVRLQMDLAAAERQLDSDPEKARGLISEAMQQSKDALEELRSLSRGFAPPILMDRGLVAALESTAVRSPIPTRVLSELPDGMDLPQEIERNAYFVATEALTNAAKHSGATEVEVCVALRPAEDGGGRWLDVVVTDNGRGGAVAQPGHGLSGLEERLAGLGGTLEVESPEGGPTVVSAHMPVAAS